MKELINELKAKPILFSTDMVKAILEGRKTETRRIIKPQPVLEQMSDHQRLTVKGTNWCDFGECSFPLSLNTLYSSKHSHSIKIFLWVRETWNFSQDKFNYKANQEDELFFDKWKPSIFMPKEACRTILQITEIKVERLQDITEESAIAEGIEFKEWKNGFMYNKGYKLYDCKASYDENPIVSYMSLWQSINGKYSWNKNPWVWVIKFKRYNGKLK